MLWKLLRETGELAPPTHLAAIFDLSEHTFRNDLFVDYKANRSAPPDDLIPQFPLIRDAVHAFNVACIEKRGYEADDLIATYAREAVEAGAEVTIVSSDKDLMQLVQPGIRMYDTMKNKMIEEAEVVERFGVPPSKVVEVQALIGNSTDNVPGVPGIGVKTAALLINEFGDLETLLARASEIKQDKRRENLINFADQARLSKTLVILDTHVPLDVPLAETAVRQPDAEALTSFMRKLEFTTLLRRVAEGLGAPLPEGMTPSTTPQRKKKDDYDHPLRRSPRGEAAPPRKPIAGHTPAQLAVERAARLEAIAFDRSNYETVTTVSRLADLLDAARYQGHFAFRVKLNSADPMRGDLAGVALAIVPGHAAYVPLAHRASDGLDLSGDTIAQIPMREALDLLKPILEDASVLKIVQNAKFDMVALARYGIALDTVDDPCLMSYALDAGRAEHLPGELAGRLLGYTCLTEKEVVGSGRSAVSFDRVGIAAATEYAGEETDIGLRLWLVLKPRLAAESVTTVYETLERPLARVLAEMERSGSEGRARDARLAVRLVRPDHRAARGRDQGARRRGLQYRLAQAARRDPVRQDEPCPAAGAPRRARGAPTPPRSRSLAAEGHDLPRKVLDWRLLAKLKSTYTDAIPAYIHPETGRVHTSYALAATHHGAALFARAEPAEHPGAHFGRPRHPQGLRRRQGQEADLGRLQPDRAPRARAYGRHADAASGLRRRARHPCHDGERDVRRADRGHGPQHPPPRQGHQFRHRLRHLVGRALPLSSASGGARRAPISRPISSASPASATTWRR